MRAPQQSKDVLLYFNLKSKDFNFSDSKFIEFDFCCIVGDLLERLLQMDPHKRLSAEQALGHPYFAQLHDPTDEITSSAHFDCSFEDKTSMQELKEAIFSELLSVDSCHFETRFWTFSTVFLVVSISQSISITWNFPQYQKITTGKQFTALTDAKIQPSHSVANWKRLQSYRSL